MSPTTDLGTGGANYFFTRINANPSSFSRGFIFKIGSLARMDAISYGGDYFGNVTTSNTATRATDPAGWKAFSRNGSNETIFKNGLDLLRDLEAIRCTAEEEKTITKALKDAGILQLPDGRPVSELFKKNEHSRSLPLPGNHLWPGLSRGTAPREILPNRRLLLRWPATAPRIPRSGGVGV